MSCEKEFENSRNNSHLNNNVSPNNESQCFNVLHPYPFSHRIFSIHVFIFFITENNYDDDPNINYKKVFNKFKFILIILS